MAFCFSALGHILILKALLNWIYFVMVNLAYIRKRKARKIIAAIALGCAAVALVIGAIAMLGQQASPFTVKLANAGVSLSLSTKEDEETEGGKVYIMADQVPEYCCYSEVLLDRIDNLDSDGTYSSFNLDENNEETATRYFKITFFVENNGSADADYDLQLMINNPTHHATNRYDMDSILRIRFYENRNLDENYYKTYAKSSATKHRDPETGKDSWKELISVPHGEDGTALPTDYAEEFLSSKLVLKSHVSKLGEGEKVRYTFVVWLEGEDPECIGNEPPTDSALVLGVDISAHASEKNLRSK